MVWRARLQTQALFNVATYRSKRKTNYDELAVFYSFENVHCSIKTRKHHQPNINRWHYSSILPKSQRSKGTIDCSF